MSARPSNALSHFENLPMIDFQKGIYLEKSASIQPRTSHSKFAKNEPKVRIEVRKNIGAAVAQTDILLKEKLAIATQSEHLFQTWKG